MRSTNASEPRSGATLVRNDERENVVQNFGGIRLGEIHAKFIPVEDGSIPHALKRAAVLGHLVDLLSLEDFAAFGSALYALFGCRLLALEADLEHFGIEHASEPRGFDTATRSLRSARRVGDSAIPRQLGDLVGRVLDGLHTIPRLLVGLVRSVLHGLHDLVVVLLSSASFLDRAFSIRRASHSSSRAFALSFSSRNLSFAALALSFASSLEKSGVRFVCPIIRRLELLKQHLQYCTVTGFIGSSGDA
jgi:hypothetical protein